MPLTVILTFSVILSEAKNLEEAKNLITNNKTQ